MKKAAPAKKTPVKNGVAAKKAESEDDDDDEDESGKWHPRFIKRELQPRFQLCCSWYFDH